MGFISIIRPFNCLITLVCVWVGTWVGRAIFVSIPTIIAACIGFCACAFGNIVNDIFDIEIDRINNSQRPLVSGRVSKSAAISMAVLFALASVIASGFLGTRAFMLVFVTIAVLFFYAAFLKKMIIGNLVVALVAGTSFIFGGIVGENALSFMPFCFALLVHLAREIVKDAIDIEGDRAGSVSSLPIIIGREKSLALSAFLLAILILVIPIPFLLKIMNITYLFIVVVGTYPLIAYVIVQVLRNPQQEKLPRLSRLLKIAMAVGLLGFILG